LTREDSRVQKPVWKTSSFLVYAGGFTVLGAALAALAYLSGHSSKAGLTGWALLMLVVLSAVAEALRRRDRWTAAGVFAFVALGAWIAFLVLAWDWFGWVKNWNSAFGGWSVAHLSLVLLILAGAVHDRRRWNFPLLTLVSALATWFFVTDFVSDGGDWTWVVTLVVGIVFALAGSASRKPSAFWMHAVGGALIGSVLLHWWHATDTDWALISAASLVYVWIAYETKRSTWAVYGTIGFFAATVHYLFSTAGSASVGGFSVPVPTISGWAPSVAFACLGFWLALLGVAGRRRANP
jgi:hypothetical protein